MATEKRPPVVLVTVSLALDANEAAQLSVLIMPSVADASGGDEVARRRFAVKFSSLVAELLDRPIRIRNL